MFMQDFVHINMNKKGMLGMSFRKQPIDTNNQKDTKRRYFFFIIENMNFYES